jgi:hypothetical protein
MMLCFLCGKEIGWLRAAVDRQYCCAQHRREARLVSSTALREEEDEQELWSVAKSKQKKGARHGNTSNQTASIFAFLALGALMVAMLMLPGTASPRGGAFPVGSLDPGPRHGILERASDAIGELVRDSAPVTLHHDFRSGLADWTTTALSTASKVDDPHDWKAPSPPSIVAPGSLRIWSRSVSMRNYQMEFQGEIEKRSLSWAFRASDPKNYYAAKIVITKPGPQPNAGLVHYAMLNGHELDRVQLPLPVTLERGSSYRVRVSVVDDHFVTYLNGQAISSWSDARLTRGGIGFFSDRDDEQRVAWVNLSERDSFMGRMLAHFSLFLMPGQPMQ